MKTFVPCLCMALSLLASAPVAAEERRPMVPEDYYRFTFLSSPRISPDSSEVVFVAATVSEDRRSRHSSLWLVSVDGGEPLRLTAGEKDSHPRWSPDGSRIAFLRPAGNEEKENGTGNTQVFLLRRAGGEALALTEVEGGVASFSWSPDGRHLLLARTTDEGSETEAGESSGQPVDDGDAAASDQEVEVEPDILVIKNAFYKRNGRGFLDAKRRHFWLFDLETRSLRQLTAGAEWNDDNPSFSPDGSHLVFDSDRSGEEYDGGQNDDLWIIPLAAAAGADEPPEPVKLTEHPHSDNSPRWSPDGERIAYLHTDAPFEQTEIELVPAAGGATRRLTADFDRHPTSLQWSADSGSLFFTAADRGAVRPFRLDVASSEVEKLLADEASVSDFTLSPKGDLVAFTLEDETRLPEVWVAGLDGRGARPLTRMNAELLAGLELGTLEAVEFANDGGGTVQGFVLPPAGLEAGKRFPLVLNIKGGPGGMWGHLWFQEIQMMAGKGWGVAFVNYRGSTGYGEAHQKAVRLDYGGVDFRDNIRLLDTVLERFDWVDRERLFVTGGSHGGFLTNWILTRTGRFRAAVTQRSVSSWISEAGTQQYTPRQMREEFGGTLWENFDLYWDRSPIKYADRITTPTLIVHGEEDHICPIGQAQELFYALTALGVETELVIFKGENHSLSRNGTPVNLVERLRRILEWFERHL